MTDKADRAKPDDDEPDAADGSTDTRQDSAAARIERGEDSDPNPLAPPVNIEAGS